MMDDESYYQSLWNDLRSGEPNLVLRIALSLVTGLSFSAAAAGGAWAFVRLSGNRYVRDEHILGALFLGGIAWVVALVVIWARMRQGRRFTIPSLITLGIAVLTIGCAAAIDEFLSGDEDVLIVAVVLAGGAAAILAWLPTVQRLLRGRPVVGPDNLVQVNCPECGYSLIGLRELRCPECGTKFTIDELIRAQRYGGVREVSRFDVDTPELPRLQATLEADAERQQV